MMLNCVEKVAPDQIEILQEFKDTPSDFDSTQANYNSLLNFSLDKYKVDENLPEDKQKGPVEMT